jgi:hypothetical protein
MDETEKLAFLHSLLSSLLTPHRTTVQAAPEIHQTLQPFSNIKTKFSIDVNEIELFTTANNLHDKQNAL